MVGDIVEPKRNTMACQDVPDRDAEGGPRKLDEGEHGAYMTEARRNRKRRKEITSPAWLAHPPAIRISHRIVVGIVCMNVPRVKRAWKWLERATFE